MTVPSIPDFPPYFHHRMCFQWEAGDACKVEITDDY